MKKNATLFCLVLLVFACQKTFAQNFWKQTDAASLASRQQLFVNNYKPEKFVSFQLDEKGLKQQLLSAPSNKNTKAGNSSFVVYIPNSEGVVERFRVVESPLMGSKLSAKYGNIKTYSGQGIDQPSSTLRFDITANGFNGIIYSSDRKTIYINSVDAKNHDYIVFDRNGLSNHNTVFDCETQKIAQSDFQGLVLTENADDNLLRDYRLALCVTGEFSAACITADDTTDALKTARVLSYLTTDLNRANGIYERDFGVTMHFVDNEDTLIFLNKNTDPWNGVSTWNSKTQQTCDSRIGNANYDIGHLIAWVANTGQNNGNAGCIGCVCKTGSKGSGFSAHTDVVGDPLVVDYWTHEMGHQFGANHTFTFSNEGTGANMEPGSASTIMGYAGITGSTDVQPHSDDYFHAYSIKQITQYIKSKTTCGVATSANDNVPTANAGANYTIPKSTPFELTATGTDADAADVLTYDWEQFDVFKAGSNTFPSATSTTGPVFRSVLYSTSPVRTFPALSSILDGTNKNEWEVLPSVSRALNFRLTVRDNHTGAGQNMSDDTKITVDATSGPFLVKTPNAAGVVWVKGDKQKIKWSVNGTNAGAVNCQYVRILLSLNSGKSFNVVLADSVANDGSATITVPGYTSTKCRIKIQAIGNVFFDINNADFTIKKTVLAADVIAKTDAPNTKQIATVYPNPATSKTSVHIQNDLNNVSITLASINGKAAYTNAAKSVKAGQTIDIPLSNLQKGMYILTIKSDEGTHTEKIIVQ